MKISAICTLSAAILTSITANTQVPSQPNSGIDFNGQTISIQGSVIDFADLANKVKATGSTHQNAASVSDANPKGGVTFWPHGESMNTNLEFDYSVAPIVNRNGDDLAIFMYRPRIAYGGIIGVTINGISRDILAEVKIAEKDGSSPVNNNQEGFFAGKIDLSDFGLADNVSADKLFISAAQTTINGNKAGYSYEQIGSASDVVFTGAASLNAAGDILAASCSAGSNAAGCNGSESGGNEGGGNAGGGNAGGVEVSEPGVLVLLGSAAGMMFAFRRKNKQAS